MKLLLYSLLISLTGCHYGVNEKTTIIGSLVTNCLEDGAWNSIKNEYSSENIDDPLFLSKIEKFKSEPFETELLYFTNKPREIIAVSRDHYSIRYIFNPNISSQVLDGLSLKLTETDKKRIRNRVQKVLMNYQCDMGKKKAQDSIDNW